MLKANHVVLQHNQDKVVLERKDLIRGDKLDDGLLSTGGLITKHYDSEPLFLRMYRSYLEWTWTRAST